MRSWGFWMAMTGCCLLIVPILLLYSWLVPRCRTEAATTFVRTRTEPGIG